MLTNKLGSKKLKKGKVYKYLYIDKFLYSSLYVHLDQNLLSLIYFLFFRGNPFNFLDRKTNSHFVNFFKPIVRLIRVGQFIYLIYRKKILYYKNQDSSLIKSSSYLGHILIEATQGEFKIINFREKSVLTVFPENYPINKIEEKIFKLKEAQKCKLSSKILDWNIDERYMRESYLNLKTSAFDFNDLNKFYSEILPILRDIILSDTYQEILLSQYFQDVLNKIREIFESFLKEGFYLENSLTNIWDFILSLNEKIGKNLKSVILLGFSHGDFWEGNILKSKNQTKVIDWNTLEKRNYFFDFYFITFYNTFYKVSNMVEKDVYVLSKEIDLAFNRFISDYLDDTFCNSVFNEDLTDSDIYRYLYYLEFILLELQVNPLKDQSFFTYLDSKINFFKFYENVKSGERFSDSQVE
ncbi:hypothetical protein [Bacillus sp. AFS088145]|uniref:hypothetical protein n=1 Tax=Bacillus sp. AFS088145 TaxID=2033514 RepID=UPI000BF52CE6|nr:hypothetical protein [Bacillus sp. AFS088145]PFH85606.1 hypothetical protein COI44_13360 [Bacillus sp. AFS088145]